MAHHESSDARRDGVPDESSTAWNVSPARPGGRWRPRAPRRPREQPGAVRPRPALRNACASPSRGASAVPPSELEDLGGADPQRTGRFGHADGEPLFPSAVPAQAARSRAPGSAAPGAARRWWPRATRSALRRIPPRASVPAARCRRISRRRLRRRPQLGLRAPDELEADRACPRSGVGRSASMRAHRWRSQPRR